MLKFLVLIFSISFLTLPTFAEEDLDAALKDVQDLMRSEAKRNDVLKANPKAQQADDFALQAVGGNQALKNDVYDVSADVMATVKELSGGDAAKMNELLQKALQNPAAFLKSLPEAQQAKIRDIAAKTEKQKVTAPIPPKH